MAKRAPTAYFVFLEQNRESTRAEVVAAASGEKVSVAVVAKALGEKWRQLSEEEKAKRIMASDPEVNRIAGDAVKATAKATELMLELMAEKAYGAARKGKRRTLKFADVDHVACTDRRFVDMGLRDVFATESTFAEARGEVGNGKENAAEREGTAKQKKAAAAAAKNSRPITDFFKA
ncbi:hypothetical protein WJX72_008959 [[Myrmecia] bisecta]|uniref:HMG box domain-containing protein n=1 Tax=[Myrmecia] bisecta TaxID=41462 RepID=A0AAW1QFU1_9CHLO